MFIKIINICFFASALLVFSCADTLIKKESLSEVSEIHNIELNDCIDITQDCNSVNRLEDEFECFELIQLENKSEAVLGEISKMQACDCGMYILDSQKSLYLFDYDGTFVSKISRKGHSKTEYTDMFNFSANSAGDTVAILDFNTVKYFKSNSVYLRTDSLRDTPHWQGFLNTDNGFFLATCNRGLEIVFAQYTNNFKTENPIIDCSANLIRDIPSSWRNIVQKNGKIICYYDYYTSTFYIYNLDDMSDSRCYSFHSPNILTEEKMRSGGVDSYGYDHLESFVFEDSIIWGIFIHQEVGYDFKLDLNTGLCLLNHHIDMGYNFLCSHNGWYYCGFDPGQLLQIADPKNNRYSATRKLLENSLKPYKDKIMDTDNYYILRMRKKEGRGR